MTSHLLPRFFAFIAVLPLALGCAHGLQSESSGGFGGEGGAGSASTASSNGATGGASTTTSSASTMTTSTSSGGPTCGDGTVDPGEECDGAAPAGKSCVGCMIVDVQSPVINEILYDPSGADMGCFIELYGPPGLDLTGYTLDAVNGSDGKTSAVASLAGHALGSTGYFVLAQDATVSVAAGSSKLVKTTADLQNGPDSVVLKSGGAIVDALGYGSFSATQFFAGEALPPRRRRAPSVASPTARTPATTASTSWPARRRPARRTSRRRRPRGPRRSGRAPASPRRAAGPRRAWPREHGRASARVSDLKPAVTFLFAQHGWCYVICLRASRHGSTG